MIKKMPDETNKASTVDILVSQLNIISYGFFDSINLFKCFPILYNFDSISNLTKTVVLTNLAVFVGSVFVYSEGIEPAISYLTKELGIKSSLSEKVSFMIYQTHWMVPICSLTYVTTINWYQELADQIYRLTKGAPKEKSVTLSISNSIYALLVWGIAYAQVQILSLIIPLIISLLLTHIPLFQSQLILQLLLKGLSVVSQSIGIFLVSIMYGWYGFDPIWISDGVEPSDRLTRVETHWAYFFGFGLPYVLLLKLTSFFVGYGLYLALFPFCIMMGSVCDYEQAYIKESYYLGEGQKLPKLSIFELPRQITFKILQILHKKFGFGNKSNTKQKTK